MADLSDKAESRYMNDAQIGYNSLEFIFEFGQALPAAPPTTHTRLITSPVCAKFFSNMLIDSISKYETAFGAIPDADLEDTEGE
jgi:hypothetical protein